MTTYTVPWDETRTAERATGHRRDDDPQVWPVPSLPEFDEWARDQQFDFFVEDVANTMAFAPTRDGERVSYQIEQEDRDLAGRIAEAVAPDDWINGRWRHGSVDDSVRDWMRQAWYDVARYGHAVYEVSPLLPQDLETPGPHGVALFRIDPREVGPQRGRWGGPLVHRTSTVDQRDHGLPPQVLLDTERFEVYTLDGDLGQAVHEAVAGLRGPEVGSVLSVAPWSHPDLYQLGYSLGSHSAVRDAVLARATRDTGWYGRGQFGEHVTGHYGVRRRVRERRFTSQLRDRFLDLLNATLAGAVERLGGVGTVVSPGTFTAADYDDAERMLDSGNHTFREVWARVGE